MSAAAPSSLHVRRFADARAPELRSLLRAIGGADQEQEAPNLAAVRRTRSYKRRNSLFCKKRKSSKVRAPNPVDVAQNADKKRKRETPLSRRVRRRVLFQDLTQGNNAADAPSGDVLRLSTHVWHAKRFNMCRMWGYTLAGSLFGKGHGARAVIRWASKGAVLHDASYCIPIQLEGVQSAISNVLGLVLEPLLGASSRGGYVDAMVHCCGKVPIAPICPATVLFQSANVSREREQMKVWMWVHAAAVTEVLSSLQAACHDSGAICRSMQGELARLEVFGTQSLDILRKALKPRGSETVLAHAHELPAKAVIPLEVYDPRDVSLLDTASDLAPNAPNATSEQLPALSVDVACKHPELSSMWRAIIDHFSTHSGDSSVLLDSPQAVQPPSSAKSMNEKHKKHRMSHFRLCKERESSSSDWRSCHIVLLKHEADKLPSWSIILPVKWVHAFWMQLIVAGARVVGQAERRCLMTSAGLASYPFDFPDCKAYHELATCDLQQQSEIQAGRPPGKRLPCTLVPPWIGALGVGPDTLAVARSSGVVAQLSGEETNFSSSPVLRIQQPSEKSWFIRVLVTADRKGVVQEGSILYAPLLEDFRSWLNRSENWQGLDGEGNEICSRPAIGFTTSGSPWRCQNVPASAVCNVGDMCKLRNQELADGGWDCRQRDKVFLLFRNPRSSKLRPAVATVAMEASHVADATL